MNTLVHADPFPGAGPRRMRTLVGRVRARFEAMRRAGQRRSALRQLEALDDRMLHDIGIHRSELESFLAELDGTAPVTRRLIGATRAGRGEA